MSALPVVIVAGFLGAGKTTLLNRVLSGNHGLRVGVVVNDFGSLVFDEELAGPVSSHRRLLANGCVCCSLQNDLLATMRELAAYEPPLDGVVVEASGVADPRQLAGALAQGGLAGVVRVAGAVTVADAECVREQEQDYGGELVLRQLRAAGEIVLGKCDLVDAGELAATRAWLHEVGATARVWEAVHGDVPAAVVLGALRAAGSENGVGATAAAATDDPHARFAEWTLRSERAFSAPQLRRAFARVPDGVVRAKGVVRRPGGAGHLLVQFAGGRLELSEVAGAAGRLGSEIVMIGPPQALDPDALERLFRDEAA